jgi:CheY-like chemotaxis protein
VSPPEDLALSQGRRIVICDYNALLLSVTGLLRMSGYCVFQAYDALAAHELCLELPDISLLVLNTTGTGTDTPTLVRVIREKRPDLPVLHIGSSALDGMPANVPTLAESFTADDLLSAVRALVPAGAVLGSPSPRGQGGSNINQQISRRTVAHCGAPAESLGSLGSHPNSY